jgi:hypothetical protein
MKGVHFISNPLLNYCPVCGHEMTITKLACNHCHTKVEGEFVSCKFCRLPKDQLEFVEVFLKCRGNIKDVEKELSISYPTVRNRLEEVLQSLGYRDEKTDTSLEEAQRYKILNALESGEITSEEATKQLRKIKN